jgi:hypothetical protein
LPPDDRSKVLHQNFNGSDDFANPRISGHGMVLSVAAMRA